MYCPLTDNNNDSELRWKPHDISNGILSYEHIQPEADRYIALLDTISFPKAKEFNEELKILVDDVVKNWRILCEDGGDGLDSAEESKRASAQGVLDVCVHVSWHTRIPIEFRPGLQSAN